MAKTRTPLLRNRNRRTDQKVGTDSTRSVVDRRANKSTVTKPRPQVRPRKGRAPSPLLSKSRIVAMYRGIGDQSKPLHYVIVTTTVSTKPVVIPLEVVIGNKIAKHFTDVGIALEAEEVAEIRTFARNTGPADIAIDIQTRVGFNGTCFGFPFLESGELANHPEGARRRLPHFSGNDLFADYKVKGTLRKWQEIAKFAKGNSRLIFLHAAACAGPLSGLLGHLPMVFILYAPHGGDGKSAMAAIASSMWGWNNDEFGFGQSCNGTPIGIQSLLASRRHSVTVLDEPAANDDRKKCAQLLTAVAFQSTSGVGRVRQRQNGSGESEVERTEPMETVVVITSNATAAEIVEWTGAAVDSQHHDRMITIGAPSDAEEGFFEALHGQPDVPTFVGMMKDIAKDNHGVVARRLVQGLERAWAKKQEKFKQSVFKLEQTYHEACDGFASGASLARLNRSFARVYAAGVLGIQAGVLLFEKKELLAAVLKCHRDCLPFRTTTPEPKAAISHHEAFEPLARFWAEYGSNLPQLNDGKFDKGNPPSTEQAFISVEKGKTYLALPDQKLSSLCGGAFTANALKKHLVAKGLLLQERAGTQPPRNVVKRRIGAGCEGRFLLISMAAFDGTAEDF